MNAFITDVSRRGSGNLCDEYAPRTSEELLGNEVAVASLRAWVKARRRRKRMTEGTKKCLLLSGAAGVGTTTAARLCLQESGYEVLESNSACARTGTELRQQLMVLRQATHMWDGRPKALLLDEVDVLMRGEPMAGEELLKHVDTKVARWSPPVVCTCRQAEYSKMADLSKRSDVLMFDRVGETQLMQLVRRVQADKGMSLSADSQAILVRTAKGDVRQLLTSLQMCRRHKEKQLTGTFEVDPHIDANRAIARLLSGSGPCGVDEGLRMFETDVSVVALMMHENYLDVASLKRCTLEQVAACADSISASGVIDEHMYGRQAWELTSAYGICSTVFPAYLCCTARAKGRSLRFGTLWSKTSNMYTKRKAHRRLHSCIRHVCAGSSLDVLSLLRATAYDLIKRQQWHDLRLFCEHYRLHGEVKKDKPSFTDMYTLLKCSSLSSVKAAYKCTHHAQVVKALNSPPPAGASASPHKSRDDEDGVQKEDVARA